MIKHVWCSPRYFKNGTRLPRGRRNIVKASIYKNYPPVRAEYCTTCGLQVWHKSVNYGQTHQTYFRLLFGKWMFTTGKLPKCVPVEPLVGF